MGSLKRALRIHPSVKRDIKKASEWYEARRPGLGVRFEAAVRSGLQLLTEHNEMPGKRYGDIRLLPVSGFPYLICHRVTVEHVEIIRVLHGARNVPRILKRRRE